MRDDLLIEIGLEEMPSSEVSHLSEAFSSGMCAVLKKHSLSHTGITAYATPRRLALWIKSLQRQSPNKEQAVWGPSTDIAFNNNGMPTKAGLAFAKKNNLDIDLSLIHI